MNDYIEEEEYYQQKIREKALLNPRIDAVFKTMFTKPNEHSRKALKSFLEAATQRKIKEVHLQSNDASIDYVDQRGVSYDINCSFEDGTSAEIEMQSIKREYDYGKRAEYYVTRLCSSNMAKGQHWINTPSAYQITVLDFVFNKDNPKIVERYNLRDEDGYQLSNLINVIFIELTKLKHYNNEELKQLSNLEKWAYFLKYADDNTKADFLQELINSQEGLMEANKVLSDISTDRSLWLRQLREEMIEGDRIAHEQGLQRKFEEQHKALVEESRAEGLAKGLAEGKAEGKAEGLAKGRAEIIIKMLNKNMSVNDIVDITGLSVDEVKNIKDSYLKDFEGKAD